MRDIPEPLESVDWEITTWEGARREQLRRWAALPLDRIVASLEEMADLAVRDPAWRRAMNVRETGGDQLLVLEEVATRLEKAGIAYMVTGSTAMNYYAVPRMTRDIDLVVELESDEVDRFVALFAEDFYCEPSTVRDAVRWRGMFNLIHIETVIKVDIIVRKDAPYRREEFARRRSAELEDATIQIVAPEDLLLSKLEWAKETGSAVQLEDARNLVAWVRDLDREYLEQWARVLEVGELLQGILGPERLS